MECHRRHPRAADRPYLTEQTAQWYVAAGALLIGYAVAVLLLYGADLLAPRRITGQVLWRELWKRQLDGPSMVGWLHYLAVDDGRADRTTAWLLPAGLADRGEPGDTVTLTVRVTLLGGAVLTAPIVLVGANQAAGRRATPHGAAASAAAASAFASYSASTRAIGRSSAEW